MKIKITIKGAILAFLTVISVIFSIIMFFSFFAFLFRPEQKIFLYLLLFLFIINLILYGLIVFLVFYGKNQNRDEKIRTLKDIGKKMVFSLINLVATILYSFVYFMFFLIITVSSAGKGGLGGDASFAVWGIIFVSISIIIYAVSLLLILKTHPHNITHCIYIEFMVLKWSSLVIFVFGLWATWYFYHSTGWTGFIGMAVWDLIFFAFYKALSNLSKKVLRQIKNWDSHIIQHIQKTELLKKREKDEERAKNLKNCPFCGEEILATAVKCKHCGEEIGEE